MRVTMKQTIHFDLLRSSKHSIQRSSFQRSDSSDAPTGSEVNRLSLRRYFTLLFRRFSTTSKAELSTGSFSLASLDKDGLIILWVS